MIKLVKSYPKGKFSYTSEQICERSFMDTLVQNRNFFKVQPDNFARFSFTKTCHSAHNL